MATATKLKRRSLLEQFAVGGADARTSPLKIDQERGIIFRVKVLGRFSRNNHGLQEAENGTDYGPCMKGALSEYEDRKVKCNHPPKRTDPAAERPIEDTFGVLQNVRIEPDEKGEPAIWADMQCLTTHPMYPRVMEDVKKGLGVYGLSHNAAAKRERFDRANKRLVIEELATVRSVDLVDKPATNRNLWESEHRPMATTLRTLLESRRAKWSKVRRKWCSLLLEDDGMAPMMDAPMEAEGGDEDDALWSGFQAAIQKVLDKYKAGECDAKECGKQIADWIKAHDKLTSKAEPEEPVEESCETDDKDKDKGKMESEEVKSLRAREKARELCESLGVVPTTLQVKAVAGLADDKEKRALIESFKGATGSGGFKTPKSRPAGGTAPPDKDKGKGGAGRETPESEVVPASNAYRTLMGD